MPTIPAATLQDPSELSDRVRIGHALIHTMTAAQALDYLIQYAASAQAAGYVVTPNAQHVVLLEKDSYLREIYDRASLVLPDGASLLFAARLLRKRLKERVTGVDLFQCLCQRAVQRRLRVFLLGGKPGSAESAAAQLKRSYPDLLIAGTYCPAFGFEKNVEQLNAVAAAVREASPHILFVALGAPKQEHWIYEHGRTLGVPLCLGIGGAFEMVGGLVPRAPEWLQKAGLEWLFRLLAEPRRLWKRYLIGNAQFLSIIARQLLYPVVYSPKIEEGL